MSAQDRSRIFGLDVMRSIAILLVVFSHADDLLDAYWPADTGPADLDGVDVFFVLSGFLIGGILIRLSERDELPWWRRLIDFWQRRWLRTLPNYFLFLLVNIGIVYFGLGPGILNVNTLAYFVFLQNFMIPLDLFFWESWSLAVEEWFYLLFPLLLFMVVGLVRFPVRYGTLMAIAVMIVLPALFRFPAVEAVGTPFMLDLLVRKIVVLRLDTIGFGVLMAWCMHVLPDLFRKRAPEFFVLGMIGLATATLLRDPSSLVYMGTWYFTFSAISMALMLPLLSHWEKTGRWSIPITWLSRISYALYLVHMPVRQLYQDLVIGASLEATILLYVGYWVLCIALSALVYTYWERPFMALRDGLSRRMLKTPVSDLSA